jgi:OH-DDVA oxygenase/3-O-methylgallate 3,4-dioxygenase
LADLMNADFDPAWSKSTRFEAGLGHAFGRALYLISLSPKTPILPVMVNTYYPPAPSASRCLRFGRAIGSALRGWPADLHVAVLASGGLSHTRIDEGFDEGLIRAIEKNDQDYLSAIPAEQMVEGTSEVRNWIIAAGIADTPAKLIDYVACYRSIQGVGCGMGFMQWPQH